MATFCIDSGTGAKGNFNCVQASPEEPIIRPGTHQRAEVLIVRHREQLRQKHICRFLFDNRAWTQFNRSVRQNGSLCVPKSTTSVTLAACRLTTRVRQSRLAHAQLPCPLHNPEPSELRGVQGIFCPCLKPTEPCAQQLNQLLSARAVCLQMFLQTEFRLRL